MRRRPLIFSFLLATLGAATAQADEPPRASIASELAVSMGSTMMLSPAAYSGARLIGTSTPNLVTSAYPALLFAALVPPAIAAGFLSWERKREGAKTGFVVPYLYSLGAQALVLAGSFLAHTWVAEPKDLMLLSAVSGVACGGFATLGAEIHFR